MLFDAKGWISPRVKGRVDGYLFAYGFDYREALQAYFAVSGRQPLLPRWALGNWWSRYCELASGRGWSVLRADPYTADEYLGLMDRFKEEGIPMSVSVLDMDWRVLCWRKANIEASHRYSRQIWCALDRLYVGCVGNLPPLPIPVGSESGSRSQLGQEALP